jgi:two-component system, chemotaxis family, chemotaxis protein CheY
MLKVVVLDTNAISRNLLTSVLVNGGYDVVGDSNITPAALASMIKLQPQLVCIDIGTADSEGLGKLATLRSELPKALVFLVSGKFEPATIESAVAHGVQGFIVKPFNAVTVLGTIRKTVIKFAKQHRAGAVENTNEAPNESASENSAS